MALAFALAAVGCTAPGLPLEPVAVDTPRPAAAIAVADIGRAPDMAKAPDVVHPGDMAEPPEPATPPLDCGYALGGTCCPDASCAIGACDVTNHCN